MLFSLPMEFWIFSQILMDVVLIAVLFLAWRKMPSSSQSEEAAMASMSRVLEPVLNEAHVLADTFGVQLSEKRGIIKKINQDLDTRIISLNLLLNRADISLQAQGGAQEPGKPASEHVVDLQQSILTLYSQDQTPEAIARKLDISQGEVDMVLALKRKFDQMAEA